MHNTLIVVDDVAPFASSPLHVITFDAYLADFPKLNEPKTRVINLCDTSRYLSQGYYCSLLAQARNHLVLPTVKTINDLRLAESGESRRLSLPANLKIEAGETLPQSFFVLFGETEDQRLSVLARKAFDAFPFPVLSVTLHLPDVAVADDSSRVRQVNGFLTCEAAGFADLEEEGQARCIASLESYTQRQWRQSRQGKQMRWDMAILVDPDESTPPSNAKAIKYFVKAAEKCGFQVDVVSELSEQEVGHYDALFIRETTAIDHRTYRLSRAAEREGVVVMDDTQSILRCCNKVYLQDAFTYQQVPAPKARFVSSLDAKTCDELEKTFGYPMVLKLPESAFSRGVTKAENRKALEQKLGDMLAASALVLVQEYIYTEYDWRIGMLGGKPIYACQYFMARNHWQIYNHKGDRFSSGGFTTMPTFEVPKPVLQAAVKAAKVVGDGLYGVDLKQTEKGVFVIEVNDNPSIDAGVEDKYLGKTLYEQVMQSFADKLEQRGR